LGADSEGITEGMIQMLARATAEVRYLNAILGDVNEQVAFQFFCYQLS
jgi:hypothetical protein